MPTYDYLCPTCGPFEAVQSMKEEPLKACPTCGGPVDRQFSTNVNFVFKGSGFYITDYRKDDYKKQAAADKPAEKPAEKAAPAPAPAAEKPSSPAPPSAPAPAAAPKPAGPSTGSGQAA